MAPERYGAMGLRDLGDEIFAHMKKSRMDHWQAQAFGKLPKPMMPPRRAFQRLQAGDAELLPLKKMAGRTVGVGVIPYPPGIPIVMPGENVGPEDGPWLGYLRTLQEWAERSPASRRSSRARRYATANTTSGASARAAARVSRDRTSRDARNTQTGAASRIRISDHMPASAPAP